MKERGENIKKLIPPPPQQSHLTVHPLLNLVSPVLKFSPNNWTVWDWPHTERNYVKQS